MKQVATTNRASALRAVIDEILARKDGRIPTDLESTGRFFKNVDDLANALLLRWHTRLIASLERGLADDPEDREEAVIEAWRHANWVYWGVRMVLDELAESPPTETVASAVRTTARNDWTAMAVAAGLASGYDELAVRVGHRLELEARHRNQAQHSTAREPKPRNLVGRLTRSLGRELRG